MLERASSVQGPDWPLLAAVACQCLVVHGRPVSLAALLLRSTAPWMPDSLPAHPSFTPTFTPSLPPSLPPSPVIHLSLSYTLLVMILMAL